MTSQAPTRVSNWNVPNALTVLRLLAVPLFGWLLLADNGGSAGHRWAASAVFAAAMLTDQVDGYLARRGGMVTDLGTLLDPVADKAMVTMALVGLSIIGVVPWWVTVLVLVREWGITALRLWVIRHGVMPASQGGKLKTVLQTIGLFMLIVPADATPAPQAWLVAAWVIFGTAVVLTLVTGVDYIRRALVLRRAGSQAP